MTAEPAEPNPPSPPSPPSPPPAAPGPRRRLGLTIFAGALGLLLLAVLVVGAGAWWTLGTAPGTAWLLAHLPGVTTEAPRGALAGDFSARRVALDLNGGKTRATLTDLGWRGVSLGRGDGPAWAHLSIDAIYASSVDLVLMPNPDQTPGGTPNPPSNLQLPIELELKSLKVGTVRATPLGAATIDGLDAALHLGADAGAVHRIDHLALRYGQISVDARARIASAAPMAMEATVDASQAAAGSLPAWAAQLRLAGPLAQPVLDASLRAAPVATKAAEATPRPATAASTPNPGAGPVPAPNPGGRAAQTLDLHAMLLPFAAWPLGELTATAKALDLSAFAATAPITSLDLAARATSSGADRPAVVSIDLANSAPGRYDEGRLPVQSLRAEIAARPDRASEIELRSVAIALGAGTVGGKEVGSREVGSKEGGDGRISAHGSWSPSRWLLDATLDGVAARRLDGRAPALTLTGPVDAAGGGAAAAGQGIDLKSRLTGLLDDAGHRRPVALTLDGSLDLAEPAKRLHLATLEASAGNATLHAAGSATLADPAAPWAVKADASLHEFDPAVWLPGDARSPWRGTRNRIDAQLAVDGSAALPAPDTSALDALAASRGRATLAIGQGTVLAGVPLAGTAALQSVGGEEAQLQAKFDAGGNSLQVDGRFATRGKATGDAFDLALDARTLATLAPVFRLFQPAGADATLAGRVTAHARLDGRWPNVTSRGDLDAEGLHVGALQLQRAVAQWMAGTAATDRVSLNATVDQLRLQAKGGAPGPSLEAATLQLGGTARAHTLDARLTTRARPPAWAEAAAGTTAPLATGTSATATGPSPLATSSGSAAALPTRLTIATLSARGGLVDQKDAALSGWRGTLQSIDVSSNAAPAVPLLRGRGLALEAFWAGGPLRASVQPGRLELLGGAIRWSELRYAAPAGATTTAHAPVTGSTARARTSASTTPTAAAPPPGLPTIDVDATIEPLRIAPLLAQAQPSFGWGGDLGVGGHIRLKSGDAAAAGVELDAVIERSGGDLTLTDEFGTRPLGLSEARVTVRADRGLWSAAARLAGSSLGTATVDASLRTSPQLLIPAAEAPLSGRVALDIADLGTLGNWVPPGWRIGGVLRADATLAGSLGRPDYTGQVVGSHITARNFLEGVKATDGDLLVRLAGTTATLDHFTVKGGDGSLRLTGLANFEAAPDVKLEITADKFQLLGRIDRKVVASGHAAVHIDARATAVTGQFSIDQGLFDITRSDAPKLDDDVTVVRAAGVLSPAAAASAAASPSNNAPLPVVSVVGPPAPVAAAPAASAAARATDLNLQLDLGQQLAIRGHGLAARLAGTLKVSSPDGKLAVNGTVSVVDGTYKAYGQDLVIDRGLIVFTGPVDRPRLDIEATRPKLETVKVGVTITGSVANPRIRLFSEPELSDVDKLSWLVVGRGSDDLGRNESALLQSAAMALVSGEGNGEPGITDRVTKGLGLDELSLGQTTDGTAKQTVVNVGKKLSDRWTIGYQGGLNAAAGSVQLIYKIAQRLTVRAQAGSESSLDLIWTWRWQ